MSQINAAATSARESARSADGKFGSYSTGEAAEVGLSTRDYLDYLDDHCSCGASLDDGEGSDGKCGDCADAETNLCSECGIDERDADTSLAGGKCRDCVNEEQASAAELENRWGRNEIMEGSRTPWGPAQSVTSFSAGVDQVSCDGHGGVKLSPGRNREIPTALRNSSGWYEEDCEAHIVAWKHPDGFTSSNEQAELERISQDGLAGVKNWMPDDYEKATGEAVSPAESYIRFRDAADSDKEAVRAAHAHEYVTTGGSHPTYLPDGFEEVTVERRTDGDERSLAVPSGFWRRNGTRRTDTPIVLGEDVAGHVDVTDVKEKFHHASRQLDRELDGRPAQPVAALGIDTSALTPAKAQRAERELGTRYRTQTGEVKSLQRILDEDDEVNGKAVSFFQHDSATYYLRLGGSHIRPVSKSTYDALTGVPETMSDTDRTRLEWSRADAALTRAQGRRPGLDVTGWKAGVDQAQARLKAATDDHGWAQAYEDGRRAELRDAAQARITQRVKAGAQRD